MRASAEARQGLRRLALLLLAVLLAGPAAAQRRPLEPLPRTPMTRGPADWLVAFWISAPPSLAVEAAGLVEDLIATGSDASVIVAIGTEAELGSRGRPDGTWLLVAPAQSRQLQELWHYSETVASGAHLGWSLGKLLEAAPARHVALVVFGHGLGCGGLFMERAGGYPPSCGGRLDRPQDQDRLFAAELARGVSRGTKGRGVDLLVLDACLMSSMHALDELRDAADVVIASPAVLPARAFEHVDWVNDLRQSPESEVEQAAGFVLGSALSLVQDGSARPPAVAWTTSRMELVANRADGLADALREDVEGDCIAVGAVRSGLLDVYENQIDLGLLAAGLGNHPAARAGTRLRARRLQAAIEASVLERQDGEFVAGSGLSAYLPRTAGAFRLETSGAFLFCSEGSEASPHAQGHHWDELLREWFLDGSAPCDL